MHTRHGVLVVPTGVKAHRETRRKSKAQETPTLSYFILSKEGEWIHCQIMPPVPQRFEWVHENNLRVPEPINAKK